MTADAPATFTLAPDPPYDFAANAAFVTHYRGSEGSDEFDGRTLTRPVDVGDGIALASVTSTGTVDRPQLTVALSGHAGPVDDAAAAALARPQIERILGVDGSPAAFYEVAAGEPALAPIAERFHGLHLTRAGSLFEAITWAVLGQQISAGVAAALRRRVTGRYGRTGEIDGRPYALFPGAGALAGAAVDDLRDLGLSLRKAEYVVGVADAFASGRVREDGLNGLDDAAVERELLALRGVGPWTVQWLLIRGLGRPDALPAGDVALQKTLGELVRGTPFTQEELSGYAGRFRPFRSYLTIYTFALIRARRVGAA